LRRAARPLKARPISGHHRQSVLIERSRT
jgi:hypothetical protein